MYILNGPKPICCLCARLLSARCWKYRLWLGVLLSYSAVEFGIDLYQD